MKPTVTEVKCSGCSRVFKRLEDWEQHYARKHHPQIIVSPTETKPIPEPDLAAALALIALAKVRRRK